MSLNLHKKIAFSFKHYFSRLHESHENYFEDQINRKFFDAEKSLLKIAKETYREQKEFALNRNNKLGESKKKVKLSELPKIKMLDYVPLDQRN